MNDPYRVLGVSPDASDEEITKAYRAMAKKYHPDLNQGDPKAEQRMKEINAAYDQIKRMRQQGESYQQQPYGNPYQQRQTGYDQRPPYSGWSPFDDFFGGQWQQQQQQRGPTSTRMQAVQNFIANGQYQQALRVLDEIEERDGLWFYFSAIANANIQNRVTALNHAREAVRLEPNNAQYQSLLAQLQQGGYTYQRTGAGHGYPMEQVGKTLMQLCAMQAACFFCCRCC